MKSTTTFAGLPLSLVVLVLIAPYKSPGLHAASLHPPLLLITPTRDTGASPPQPDLYILAIGTNSNLRYPPADARAFARLFAHQGGRHKLYRHVYCYLLIGSDATRDNILQQLRQFNGPAPRNNDVYIFFISCHGDIDEGGLELVGSPSPLPGSSYINFNTEILCPLQSLDCKKILFLDACYSGLAPGSKSIEKPKVRDAILQLLHFPNGLAIFSSCDSSEQSFETPNWKHGCFTKAIIDGLLHRKADSTRQGIIYLDSLFAYVQKRVPALVIRSGLFGRNGLHVQQHPIAQNPIGNIPFYKD